MYKAMLGVNETRASNQYVSRCRKQNKRLWPFVLAIVSAAAYLIFLPGGMLGYSLPLFALLIVCFAVNPKSLGVFCLLIGLPTFGGIFRSFDIPYAGSLLALGVAFFGILPWRKEITSIKLYWHPSVVFWLLITIGTLAVSYMFGPQTDYSWHKMSGVLQGLFFSILAFAYLFKSPRCDMWEIGVLGILGGLAYYAAILFALPNLKPGSIFLTAGLRFSVKLVDDLKIPTGMIALIISIGLVLIASSLATDYFGSKRKVLTIALMFVGLLLLNSIGQRLFMFLPVICILTILACRPKNKQMILSIAVGLLIVTSIVVIVGIQTKNSFITSVFIDNSGIAERSNRSINWDAAIDRIQERPWFGHGLGGYYIRGFSFPGSGTYPHNMVLELLSETGLVGTLIILGPIIIFLTRHYRTILMCRTVRGQIIFPTLLLFFGHAMISHDLTKSSWFLGLLACLWVYQQNLKRLGGAKNASY